MATILVVDDRPLNREYLVTLLGYYGHVLLEAADGAEALAVVRAQHPDLVISDLLMPTMDGIELAHRLRGDERTAALPVIFYTATYRVREARELGLTCGVTAVLAKPAEPQEILAAVNAALGLPPPTAAQLATPPEQAPGSPAAQARDNTPDYLQDLALLQQQLQRILEEGLSLLGEQGELSQLSERLTTSLTAAQSLGLRLTTLIELGLELASERDVPRLLELFVRAAQDILSAKYAAVGLADVEGRVRLVATRGLPESVQAAFAGLSAPTGILGRVLATGRPQLGKGGDPALGLPAGHPPVQELLAVPVKSSMRVHGWVYVADKLGADAFSAEDERISTTLAAQLALAYENLALYDDVRQHAGQLEHEAVERQQAEAQLRESEQHFRQLAENIREVFFLVDPASGQQLYVSPAYEDIWGRSLESVYATPMAWADAIIPEDRGRLEEILQKRDSVGQFDDEYRIARPDGAIRWIWVRGFPILNAAGQLYRVAGIAEDITERKQQQAKIARLSRIQAMLSGINSAIVRLHERQALFDEACRIAVEHGGFGLAWIGLLDKVTLAVQPVAGHGIEAEALGGLRLGASLSAAGIPVQAQVLHDLDLIQDLGLLHQEVQAGAYRSVAALPLLVDGAPVGVLLLYAREAGYFDEEEMHLLKELAGDISFALQYIEREERLQYLAYYDALTGLPNRALFQDRLEQFLHSARHERGGVAVILLDLDRFKQLNDSLGRHVGDALLRTVGERLGAALEQPCVLARVTADTFAVAVAGLPLGTDATSILRKRIFAPLEAPLALNGGEVHLAAKAGIALYPADGQDAETLFTRAEAALKQAQATGERYLYYAPEINARIAEKLVLESELHTALEAEQFVLYYQPRVSLRSGRIAGAEALIRWQHPQQGLVGPGQFIPLAEQTGLIVPIGAWVLRNACAQQTAWLAEQLDTVPVAVNLSAVQFHKGEVLPLLRELLEADPALANYLELELTESVVMQDPDEAARLLHAFRGLGLRLALDDFGTGYSSLAYLKRFPFDVVKIDRSFVTDITHNPGDAAIAIAVIGMAQRLNLRVVAEGVETEGQLNYLRASGCDEIQGYYFSPPVPAAEFAAMLRSTKRLPPRSAAEQEERTVLVIDDEPGVQNALIRALRPDGYRVLTAAGAEEALELLALHRVQVVICDQRLPGMSGTELLDRVKSLHPDTIRMVLSGYTDLNVVIEAVNRGAIFKFLTKPWEDELLREHIRDAFLRYRSSAP
ncbi:EAL domain-containing protein [Pseudomonas sp.]|uniref:EAL domain-containing protein n=1 Tax=Pseudomonas sp. TaxID=306 RepID=UPI002733E7B4|nr:EAL domain-containing protein [Pseudomonas sp.]MDP3814765.1 EAL domain-containing protein [Pseudomonas sp.]